MDELRSTPAVASLFSPRQPYYYFSQPSVERGPGCSLSYKFLRDQPWVCPEQPVQDPLPLQKEEGLSRFLLEAIQRQSLAFDSSLAHQRLEKERQWRASRHPPSAPPAPPRSSFPGNGGETDLWESSVLDYEQPMILVNEGEPYPGYREQNEGAVIEISPNGKEEEVEDYCWLQEEDQPQQQEVQEEHSLANMDPLARALWKLRKAKAAQGEVRRPPIGRKEQQSLGSTLWVLQSQVSYAPPLNKPQACFPLALPMFRYPPLPPAVGAGVESPTPSSSVPPLQLPPQQRPTTAASPPYQQQPTVMPSPPPPVPPLSSLNRPRPTPQPTTVATTDAADDGAAMQF